jgi:hypothetical protein
LLHEAGVLDQHHLLKVHNNGVVRPGRALPSLEVAVENQHERQGQRRSPAGPRQGTTRRKGTSSRRGQTGSPTRVVSELRSVYEAQLKDVGQAYPTLRTFPQDRGMWLRANSAVLPGLDRDATFLVAVPFVPGVLPRGWAFWNFPDERRWIGPRHTNPGDGSICAFSQRDKAWLEGQSLTALLDLYSVWSLRHLFFEVFGWWPGKQYSIEHPDLRVRAYYRRVQCQDCELCGCGSESLRYAECCKPGDYSYNFIELASFARKAGGSLERRVPQEIVAYLDGHGPLPVLSPG